VEHAWIYAVGGILIAIILVTGILIAREAVSSLPVTSEGPTYKTLQYSGEDRINLLFFGSELLARSYAETLLTTEPFGAYKDAFNVYVIEDYDPECELYKGIAILCDSHDLQKEATRAPHDYIIVLKSEPTSIRSSSFKDVMSINLNHPRSVIVHEFGHAFANFAEEYAPAKIPKGAKNCVVRCDDFGTRFNECKQECSDSSHYRAIPLGVMRSLLTTDYGIYNRELIREILREELPNFSPTGLVVQDESICNDQVWVTNVNNPDSATLVESGCPAEQTSVQISGDNDLLISTIGLAETADGTIQTTGGFEKYTGEVYTSTTTGGTAKITDKGGETLAAVARVGNTACKLP
jgi:hypothetical protein